MEAPNVLILGGTTEATALCHAMADVGVAGTISFAGRVERPVRQPLPQRVGGFGGIPGLVAYLRKNRITHLIDATHPFAAQMSIHAVAAATEAAVPLLALTRPAWDPQPEDNWVRVPDLDGAVRALDGPRRRVMLAIGRMHLGLFANHPQHFYLLRLVDPPEGPLPVPDAHVEVSRGPFTLQDDRALIERHGIDLIVSKNAGGSGARAKIDAARALGLPVVMIDRPVLPPRTEVHEVAAALDWLRASSGDTLATGAVAT